MGASVVGALSSARAAALDVVCEVRRRRGRVRDVLRCSGEVEALDPRDRALTTRLAVGAVRASGTLDGIVRSHVTRGHLEPRLADALRVSTFEILFLDTPAQVSVSQGVSLAASVAPRARGLANAILRRVAAEDLPRIGEARERLQALVSLENDQRIEGVEPTGKYGLSDGRFSSAGASEPSSALVADISLAGCLPQWLAEEVVASLGPALGASLALRALEPPAATVALNPSLGEGLSLEALSAAALDESPLPWPGAYRLGRQAGLARSGLVRAAKVLPCDLAAQVVAWTAASCACGTADRPARLLEVGQGRATKTILMAGAAQSWARTLDICSVELEESKVRLACERLRAAAVADRCKSFALDATSLSDDDMPMPLQEPFDVVFVDAPCSGSGTLRRHPEIAWSLSRDAVRHAGSLPALQLEILTAAASRVAPGGELLYSTCSILVSEDVEVVQAFLNSEKGSDFRLASVTDAPIASGLRPEEADLLGHMVSADGMFRSSRGTLFGIDCDGHFLARLVRTGGTEP